ncbi:phosphoenolpyruvate carboxykinase (ATP) [Ancylobacter lacus]|uniref:hypothetical protein n=1 Tax=Ancylobacter lacus TaxID=2579970 RepID=UPI001BCDF250|nr:hypothetical protein [Ancylobacter lacus]MBS7538693.1 hypothetical protein [Ancylobacter lacus]
MTIASPSRATSRADIVLLPFAGGSVVQHIASGRLWLFDTEDDGARAADALREENLPPVVPPERAEPPDHPPAFHGTIRLGPGSARVRCWPDPLARTFSGALAPMLADAPAGDVPAGPRVDLFVTPEGQALVTVDGVIAHRPGSAPMGRWLAIRQLAARIHAGRRWLALFHAAAVALPGGGAVLLPAASGSGKTTLAGALLAHGGTLLSDDLAPVDADTGEVWPFPMAMSVKPGSWPVFTELHPGFAETPPSVIGATTVRYFRPAGALAAAAGHPVAAIVLPRYEAGSALRAEPVPPRDLLRAIIAGGTWPPEGEAELRSLLALLERVPACRLVYGDVRAAARALTERRLPAGLLP